MLTREERLWTMKGQDLIRVADKCGVKVKCNKPRTQLKESKEAVISRILEAEAEAKAAEAEDQIENQIENPIEGKVEDKVENQVTANEVEEIAENDDNINSDNGIDDVNISNVNSGNDSTAIADPKKNEPSAKENLKPKKGALLEFNGKSQNICAWAKELGISANTLYGRIYKMGWSVERAFTTPSRK